MPSTNTKQNTPIDVVLIGAGVMSATLATLLKQLDSSLNIVIIEKGSDIAQESSDGWNNAGTGHASWCELNYTPENSDGHICTKKACSINESFEITLQLWSYLVHTGALADAKQFITATPHLSLVFGHDNVAYLRKRFALIKENYQFETMEFSKDTDVLKRWMPLVMKGREANQPIAATRINYGSDVDFGALSKGMIKYLQTQEGFELLLDHRVHNLQQDAYKFWATRVTNTKKGTTRDIKSRFVFIGAGGGSLPLLQKSGIKEGKGYGGFPVSGQFLVCKKTEIVEQHQAKVYGKAPIGAPPMSVPHLDTRIIEGEKALLFGPFAGFTTKFLKQGSFLDLVKSVKPDNIIPMLASSWSSLSLIRYLIKEVFQNHNDRMNKLREYYPNAKNEDWQLITAGQRVQIIKRHKTFGGKLQFGTEIVTASDGSLSALLGASPGASTAVETMINVIETCFSDELESPEWQAKMKLMIPSYQESLKTNPELLKKIREQNLKTLGLTPSP